MNLTYQPRKNGRVVILGAGASYGASLRHTPPIMRDFVRVGKKLAREDYSALWSFLNTIGFSSSQIDLGHPNLEELYIILDTYSKGLWHDREDEFIDEIGKAFWKVPPVYFLEAFILEVTSISSMRAIKKSCKYHDYVVRELRKGDTIISFNYDLIADASVSKNHKWTELDGYGFPCFNLLERYENKYDSKFSSDVALLKPHGSLNWKAYEHREPNLGATNASLGMNFSMPILSFHQKLDRTKASSQTKIEIQPLAKIKDHAYGGPLAVTLAHFYEAIVTASKGEEWKFGGIQAPPRNTFILPPSTSKFRDSSNPEEISTIWSAMRRALKMARDVLIIGYSFPPTDIEFSTLFRLAMNSKQENNAKIRVVDPDPTLIERISEIAPKNKVVHIANSLKEYVERSL
jgi:hypothetical protein